MGFCNSAASAPARWMDVDRSDGIGGGADNAFQWVAKTHEAIAIVSIAGCVPGRLKSVPGVYAFDATHAHIISIDHVVEERKRRRFSLTYCTRTTPQSLERCGNAGAGLLESPTSTRHRTYFWVGGPAKQLFPKTSISISKFRSLLSAFLLTRD